MADDIIDLLTDMGTSAASVPNPAEQASQPTGFPSEASEIRSLLGELANQIPTAQLPASHRWLRRSLANEGYNETTIATIVGDYNTGTPSLMQFQPQSFNHLLSLVRIFNMPVDLPVVKKIGAARARVGLTS